MDFKMVRRALMNLLFPPKCVFCGELLKPSAELFVCEACERKLPRTDRSICQRCGARLDQVYGNFLCAECRNHKRYFERARAPFRYTGEVKHGIVLLKFYEKLAVGDVLAHYMAQIAEAFGAVEVVTFVPMLKSREQQRGYNQAELLARAVAKRLAGNPPVEPLLVKIRDTQVQSHLSREERMRNVRGVFEVSRAEKGKGKCVLLIDDVLATGATVNECAKALVRAGASRVFVLTAATSDFETY